MVEPDEVGQSRLEALIEALDDCVLFTDVDHKFLIKVANVGYADLNRKQKSRVIELYEDYLGTIKI